MLKARARDSPPRMAACAQRSPNDLPFIMTSALRKAPDHPPAARGGRSARYTIRGGHAVTGRIRNLGAKNFATKAMVAALLSEGTTRSRNVPRIGDVELTAELLKASGAGIAWRGSEAVIDAGQVVSGSVPLPDSGSNRIPILLLGVLLNRLGEAHVPVVSGCNIGARPVDFHLEAARLFGAT